MIAVDGRGGAGGIVHVVPGEMGWGGAGGIERIRRG